MINGSKFATRVIRSLRHRLGYPPRLVTVGLGNTGVKVREGLVMPKPDKDDAWMAALVLDCNVFLDLGCNVGFWSLYAGVTSPERKVIAWDTNVEALSQCAENLFRNGLCHRVRFVLAFAAAQADQQLDFYTVGTGSAGSRYPGHARTAAARKCFSLVQTNTVDRVLTDLGLVPDLVKIDIEGAEAEALQGAKELAQNTKPRFCVEMHSPPELPMVENCRRVLAWCQEVGYKAYYMKAHSQIFTPDPIAHRGRCHLLLIPDQAEYPLWLKTVEENSSVEQGMSAFQTRQK